MRRLGLFAGFVLLSTWGARADIIAPTNRGFEAGTFTHEYAPLNSVPVAYDLSGPAAADAVPELADAQTRVAADVSSQQLLDAATSDNTSLTLPVDEPTARFLDPLLSVPEPNTFELVILPLLLTGALTTRGKRQGCP